MLHSLKIPMPLASSYLALVVLLGGCSDAQHTSSATQDTELNATKHLKPEGEVQAHTPTKTPANIIVILADDMRTHYTGHEGHAHVLTPHLDNLAKKGTVFTSNFATSPVCMPSRTSLLTGQYERKHGVNFNSNSALSQQAFNKTYPMLLKQAGYYAGYIGKNHTPIGANDEGLVGYASGVMDTSFDYWYASHGHLGFYPKDVPKHAIFKNAESDTQVEIIEEGMENFFTPNKMFEAGAGFLAQRPENKPFALLINFNVPHNGGTGSMEFRDADLALYKTRYRDQLDSLPLPPTYVAEADIQQPKLPKHVYNGEYIESYNYVKTAATLRERNVREIQTISGVDKFVGKLIQQLNAHGLAENTVIVFTSDHGILHGEFGMGGKSLLYEPSVKIPLIIYDPRIQDPVKHSDELVTLVDIAPTLLEIGGVPIPKDMQGTSLNPLLTGEHSSWRQDVFLENMMTIQNYPRIEAVRTKEWKYIRYFDRKNDQAYADMLSASIKGEQPIYEELFNIGEDPHETTNLILAPEHKLRATQMRTRTGELVTKYRGTQPLSTIPLTKREAF